MPKTIYMCEICKKQFDKVEECQQHEKDCEKIIPFRDDFSREVISYKNTARFNQENEIKKNQCHTLVLNQIPRLGSLFESEKIEFYLTDSTLVDMFRLSPEAQLRCLGEIRYEFVEEEE
jgi:hypothetical protein